LLRKGEQAMAEISKSYPIFDCDAHIFEGVSIWRDYLSEQDKELVRDHGYWADLEYAGVGLLNGSKPSGGVSAGSSFGGAPGITPEVTRRLHQMALTPEQHAQLSMKGSFQPDHRIREMDLSGIDQVLIIPTNVILHFSFVTNIYAARAL